MRLYHYRTLQILASREDIPKRYSCSVWSEIFKWKASGQKHPKMFIDDEIILGRYLFIVYILALVKGCKLDKDKVKNLSRDIKCGFVYQKDKYEYGVYDDNDRFDEYFDDNYLFSDACSLYFKGINIFPDLFPDNPEKYIPVISHKEIIRQCNKTLNK